MYYHGTEKDRGNRILKRQKMEYSRSTLQKDHWLGDGIYLYREKLYVFRWIALMYEERHNYQDIETELYHKYSILGVEIDCSNERIFRLENPEHLMIFEQVKKECKKKCNHIKGNNNNRVVDGVIFNIMFKELGYSSEFDLIECNFNISELDSDMQQNSRIRTIKECQLCIKNPNIIKKIIDVSEEFPLKEYLVKYKNFNRLKKSDSSKYGRSDKYGKWKKN